MPEQKPWLPLPDPLGIMEKLTEEAPIQLKDPLRHIIKGSTRLKESNSEEKKTWLERLGDCYRLALRFIIKEDEGWLVHGRIFAGTPLHWMEHAWVELPTGYIYEPVADTLYKKDTFYQAYKAEELKRYTPTQAAKLAARFGHYGPWYD